MLALSGSGCGSWQPFRSARRQRRDALLSRSSLPRPRFRYRQPRNPPPIAGRPTRFALPRWRKTSGRARIDDPDLCPGLGHEQSRHRARAHGAGRPLLERGRRCACALPSAHVTPSLITRGQANYSEHYAGLRRLEARYGVDPAVLMAIWGMETSYGTVTGSTDLLGALASLGYYGRRRDLFENEFVSALKLIDLGVPRYLLKGSWAGATGYPQFMPSVVLRLRADGDGDGYADIWSNELDGLASIAAYMRDAGWKPNVPWGIAVRTPSNLNRYAIVSRITAPRCPQVYKRMSRWLTHARVALARRDADRAIASRQ